MPRGKRTRGPNCQVARASCSFNEFEVAALLYAVARLEAFGARSALVPLAHAEAFKSVTGKFLNMRGSIEAAKAARRAREGEAAQ